MKKSAKRTPRLPRVPAVKIAWLFFVLFFKFIANASAQNPDGSRVNWMTIEEAVKANKQSPRPILMDFYTDWCGWCKRMMATTYADPGLASYINQNFYPVKFDAEGKDTVVFAGKRYEPTGPGARLSHPLAVELLQGKLMYPSTLFMHAFTPEKEDFQFKLLVPGYLDKQKLEPFLVYTMENVFRTTPAEAFSAAFDKAFYDTTLSERINKTPWIPAKTAFDGNFQSSRKKLVFIHTSWCNSCRVMQRGVFTDTSLTSVLKPFELIDFDAELQDPLFYLDSLYQRDPSNPFPFHPLTLVLTRKNFVLPCLAVLDEQGRILDAIRLYANETFMKDMLEFYGNDHYKKMQWAEFLKSKGKG
jgi:thioredoxin-related protein